MKNMPVLFFSVLIICVLPPLQAQDDAAQRLYQEGIFQMEAMGDFSAAIELFEKLVSEYPGNKSLASRALLMAGRCYEKMGQEEAEKAYNRILEEYGDQREIVNEARARLMALSQRARLAEHTGMLIRKIWQVPGVCAWGHHSPDERTYVSYDRRTGDLSLLELATGQTHRLRLSSGPEELALFPVFSPDGKHIAYTWYDKNRFCGLRLFDQKSGEIQVLLEDKSFLNLQAFEWSPDGKAIVVLINTIYKEFLLFFYRIEEDSLSLLKSFDKYFYPTKFSFSPDGKYLAYDHNPDKVENQRSIFTIDIESNEHNELVDHPSENIACGWTSDGKQLVFISDRTGNNALWTLAVKDGKAAGTPVILKTDISQAITPFRLTETGSFYYGIDSGGRDVYTASFNPDEPEPFGPPVKISQRYQGMNRTAAWSNDGRYIAYVSSRRQREIHFSNAVIIHDVESGQERNFFPNVRTIADYIGWSPDDKFIVIRASYLKDNLLHNGILILNTANGEIIDTIEAGQNTGFFSYPIWSRDGKNMYFFMADTRSRRRVLIERNMETAQEKILFESSERNDASSTDWSTYYMIYSSDDNMLVFSRYSVLEKRSDLFLLDLNSDNPEPRKLLTTQTPQVILWGFSYHANKFYCIKTRLDENYVQRDQELWSVNISSGEIRKIVDIPESFVRFSLHPDGKSALFNMGPRGKTCEIWVIENLLPKRLNE